MGPVAIGPMCIFYVMIYFNVTRVIAVTAMGWIVIALILGVIELFSITFILLWIAIAAFITGLFGLLVPFFEWQVSFFVVLSAMLLVMTWRFSKRVRNRPSRFLSRVDELVNLQAQVVEGWSSGGSGLVKVHGEMWSARGSTQDAHFEKDSFVRIITIDSTQLVVEKL